MTKVQIEYKDIKELQPYRRNPRRNDGAVDAVAASIKEFGWQVPMVVTKEGVIVAGHTRYKAAKKLGIRQIPCIIAENLTEEQINAFRLADNKVSELADWDELALGAELDGILNIDMSEFGFDLDFNFDDDEKDDDDDIFGYYGDARENTYNIYNLNDYDETAVAGFYQLPTLEPCDIIPSDMITFNYMLSTDNEDAAVCFYIDDYQFERVWVRPWFYAEKMERFEAVLTPDFSTYLDMPMAMKIWNIYRSRLVGQIWQAAGLNVIPTVQWAEPATFDFCFEGLPENSVLSVSTIGVKKARLIDGWRAGMDETIKRLHPKCLLVYGGEVDYDYGDTEVIYYDNHNADRLGQKEGE